MLKASKEWLHSSYEMFRCTAEIVFRRWPDQSNLIHHLKTDVAVLLSVRYSSGVPRTGFPFLTVGNYK